MSDTSWLSRAPWWLVRWPCGPCSKLFVHAVDTAIMMMPCQSLGPICQTTLAILSITSSTLCGHCYSPSHQVSSALWQRGSYIDDHAFLCPTVLCEECWGNTGDVASHQVYLRCFLAFSMAFRETLHIGYNDIRAREVMLTALWSVCYLLEPWEGGLAVIQTAPDSPPCYCPPMGSAITGLAVKASGLSGSRLATRMIPLGNHPTWQSSHWAIIEEE